MTPRTRKLDQTERCAKCGQRGLRNEMERSVQPADNPAGRVALWYHRDCWPIPSLITKSAKENEHAQR
jgi:hypothetical protein